MKSIILFSWILVGVVIITTCNAWAASEHLHTSYTHTENTTIKVGITPEYSNTQLSNIWTPILTALNNETGITFILETTVDLPEFEKRFINGDFDLAYIDPYHAIIANQASGYRPILRDIARNVYGILVTQKDSSIKTIQDLKDKQVAFPAPNAFSAHLLPRFELAKQWNITVNELYVSNHSSVYLNVILGVVEAGGGTQKTLQQQADNIQQQLQIIYKTQAMPSNPIVVHPRIPNHITNILQKAFLNIASTTAGKQLLGKIPIKVIGEATLTDYKLLSELKLDEFHIR